MYNYSKKFKKVNFNKFGSSDKKVTHKLIASIVNNETGEIEEVYETSYKKKISKRGWCKMYPKDFANTISKIVHKPLALNIYLYFMQYGYFKKDGTIKNFKQVDLAKHFNVNKSSVSKAIKVLKNEEIIAQIDNEWRYNPFLVLVSGQSDDEAYEAQYIWDKYMSAYEFDKNKKETTSKYKGENDV